MIEAPWLNLHAGSEKPDRRACNQKCAPLNGNGRREGSKKRGNTPEKLPGERRPGDHLGLVASAVALAVAALGRKLAANEPDPGNATRAVRQTRLKLTYTENGKADPGTNPRGSISVQSDRRRPPLSNPRRTTVEPFSRAFPQTRYAGLPHAIQRRQNASRGQQ